MTFINVTEDTYVSHGWFLPGGDKDFLMFVYRPTKDLDFKLIYRFRYYKDDKHFDSEDESSAYTVSSQGGEAVLVAAADHIIEVLEAAGFNSEQQEKYRVHIDGGSDAFLEKWCTLPFAHVKVTVCSDDVSH